MDKDKRRISIKVNNIKWKGKKKKWPDENIAKRGD
jgi:hypothetical protein